MRFQKSSGQLEKTARIRIVRRQIARIKTIINNKGKINIMPKRILKGVVVSDKANKTITVLVREKLCILFIKNI